MVTLPAMPVTLASAAAMACPGTATRTTSAADPSPPSRPNVVTSCPAFDHIPASPPPIRPRPTVTIFMYAPHWLPDHDPWAGVQILPRASRPQHEVRHRAARRTGRRPEPVHRPEGRARPRMSAL